MINKNAGTELTFIKTISLFNSGNYAFFEEDFNQNIILEGNNNIGKTTILNSLQLLLLPETNLKNFKNKFSIATSQNKSFTSKETYDFYFPSENSYIIIEVQNELSTFCVILHKTKVNNNNYEYGRLLVELPFDSIKKHLIKKNKTDTILNNIEREKLFTILKKETNGIFKEIRETKEVTNYLLSTRLDGKPNKYCIVPLKDTKKDTLQGFSTLLKSLYNISNMNQDSRKKFVADIIESRKITNEDKKYIDFDLKETIEKNNELINRKEYFNIMDNNIDYFDKLVENYEEFSEKNIQLKLKIKNIYDSIIDEMDELEDIKDKFNENNDINEKNLITLKSSITENNNDINNINEQTAVNNSLISRFLDDYRNVINNLFALEDFKKYNKNNNNLSQENTLKAILSITPENKENLESFLSFTSVFESLKSEKEKDIENLNANIQNLENINQIQKEYEQNVKDIKILKSKIKLYSEQLEQQPLYLSSEFTEKEQKVLKTLFKDSFLYNSIEKISPENITKMKDFFKIFDTNKTSISIDKIGINILDFSNNSNELIEKKEELEKELEDKIKQTTVIETKNDIDVPIMIKEIEGDIEFIQDTISEYENCIYLLKNILTNNKKFKKLEDDNIILKNKLESISEQKQETTFKMIDLENEMNEQKKIFNNSFTMLKRLEEYVNEIEDFNLVEEYFFQDVNEIELTIETSERISDPISEFLTYKKRLEAYKNIRIEIISIISKFVSNHIFDNEVSKDVIDVYSELSEHGEKALLKLIEELISKYSRLEGEKALLKSEIESLNNEIINTNGELLEMVNEIKKFRKEINSELENIQISNLPGVSFDIDIDRKLLKLLQDIESIDFSNYNSENMLYFEKLSNYIFSKTKQNNLIKIVDLIENVDYSIFSLNDETGKKIKTKNSQSNGTEIMINLLFISILFDSIFKENKKLQLVIPLDEVSNVDYNNISTLLDTMKKRNCKIIAAAPLATPDQLSVFDRAVTIDKEVVKKKISDKAQYIVLKDDNKINIFSKEED